MTEADELSARAQALIDLGLQLALANYTAAARAGGTTEANILLMQERMRRCHKDVLETFLVQMRAESALS